MIGLISCVISIACSGISADGPVYRKDRTNDVPICCTTHPFSAIDELKLPAGGKAFDRSIVFASNGTVTVFWKRSSSDRFRGMDAVFHIQPRSSDLHVYPSSPLLDRAGQNRPFRACSGNLQCVSTGLVDRHTAFGGRVGCRHCPARPAVPGLTPEGERLLQWARILARDWEGMRQEAALCSRQITGTLRIGAIPTTLAVTPSSRGLTRRNVPAWPSSCYRFALDLIRQLDRFELDLGLTYLEDPPQGFRTLPLYRNGMCCWPAILTSLWPPANRPGPTSPNSRSVC